MSIQGDAAVDGVRRALLIEIKNRKSIIQERMTGPYLEGYLKALSDVERLIRTICEAW